MNTAPGNAFVPFGHLDLAQICGNFAADLSMFKETGARFDIDGLNTNATELDFDQSIRCQQIGSAQQQRINRIRGRFGRLPILSLLLLQQPNLAIFDRLGIIHHFIKRFDNRRLRFDRSLIPPL